jgi:gluconolactonase
MVDLCRTFKIVLITGMTLGIEGCETQKAFVARGVMPEKALSGFRFTEGVTADTHGGLYFSDLEANRIYHRTPDGKLLVLREQSRRSNGLAVDRNGRILACESATGGRLVSIDPNGAITVLAETFEGKHFNSLNDLWIDPKGGIYFTDPRYGTRRDMEQDGEHVYYLKPDRKTVIRVINDMDGPNGLIGTPDGQRLYVSDQKGKQTFVYDINSDGTLTHKRLFAPVGSDGMTIDQRGNVYLTTRSIGIYDPNGRKMDTIEVPETPSNLCFGGKKKKTLFIAAGTSLYSIEMGVKGVGSN